MVGIVIATHCAVAAALLDAAEVILGPLDGVVAVSLAAGQDRDMSWTALEAAVDSVDGGHGVLVLADMFGGTPSNLAMALLGQREVEVVTGVNLPMVLRAVQNRGSPLRDLVAEVLQYGRRNVTCASDWLRPGAESPSGGNER